MPTMVDQLTHEQENRERIHAVEVSFGASGKPLARPGRVLVGEGRLMKQSRRSLQPKMFFLFSDVLVYGSIIMNGRWYNKQQIIPLEDVQLEDLEDGDKIRNQWLIRTPRKSFYVSAASNEEKRAWIEHTTDCQSRLLQGSRRSPGSTFAVTWIPDQASAVCMLCSDKFTITQRRHHCRKCGFIVCGACSKTRAVITHIHPTKQLRVCCRCVSSLPSTETQERRPLSVTSTGKMGLEEEEVSSEEEEEAEDNDPCRGTCMSSWSPYIYLRPEHIRPKTQFRNAQIYHRPNLDLIQTYGPNMGLSGCNLDLEWT